MPGSFTFYVPRNTFYNRELTTISPTSSELQINFYVYSDPALTNKIGDLFSNTFIKSWDGNLLTDNTTFIKFLANSGVPYGDNNILVGNLTTKGKLNLGSGLVNGIYYQQVNTFLSIGEYAGQSGTATITRDSSVAYDKVDVSFTQSRRFKCC